MQQEHKGSRELYDAVAEWCPGPLLFSKRFGWDRWGLLGVLADYVLYYVPGCIVEVGCCESSIYFSRLGEKYNRKVYHCDLQRSIIENCLTVAGYFGRNSSTYIMSSDQFFASVELDSPAAIVFIDGDHEYEPVARDFRNACRVLHPSGFIFLHDTLPPTEEWTGPTRCGGVYRLRREIEENPRFDIFSFPFTAWGVGLSVVRRREESRLTGGL